MANEKIEQLDPEKVLADDNARYGLTATGIQRMTESILQRNGVQSPVEVERLPAGSANGFTHRLTAGFYRHAAVLQLNKEQGAGLKLPAIVRTPADAKDRLTRQLSENIDRETLSPMDTAVAIEKALAQGMKMTDVQVLFRRVGGRKGNELSPMSQSMITIYRNMLTLPKAIQAKIHDGRVSVGAAYQLTRVAPEDREAVLAKAEENRLKELEREEKADERLSKQAERDAKVAETEAQKQAKVTEAENALKTAQEAYTKADEAVTAAKQAQSEAATPPANYLLPAAEGGMTEEEKKGFAEKLGAAKQAKRDADKALAAASKAVDKAKKTLDALTAPPVETPADSAPAPAPAPAAAPAKNAKKGVGESDVKKAAREIGAKAPASALSAKDARDAAAELAKSRFPKVKAIGQLLAKLLAGELVPKQVETELSVLTGERKTKQA